MADGRVIIDAELNSKEFESGINGMSATATKGLNIIKNAAIVGGTALVALGTTAVNEYRNFEIALSKVATIADTSKVSMDAMKESIMKASSEIGVASEEVAEAVYQAISAGVDTADAVDFVTKANKLAVAGFTDVTKATDVLTTVVNAYGMEIEDVTKVSDVLMMTQNAGKTTVDELASSLGKAIPIANANGVSFENIGSAMATATAKGIATSEATTYLSSMMKELGTSSTNVAQALKEKTGKSFKQLMDDGASLSDVLGIVGEIASDSGVGLNEMFGSAEAGTMALTLMSDGGEAFTSTLEDMNQASGVTDSGFETMQDTLDKRLQTALVNVQNAMITLGEKLAPLVVTLAEAASDVLPKLIDGLSWLMDNSGTIAALVGSVTAAFVAFKTVAMIKGVVGAWQNAILQLALYQAGAGGATLAQGVLNGALTFGQTLVGLMTGQISLATVAQKLWNLAMSANPIGLIIGLIAGLVAGIVILWNTNEDFRNALIGAWEAIKNAALSVWDWLVKLFTETLPNAFNSFVNEVKNIGDRIAKFFTETIPNAFNSVVEFFANNWQTILGFIINPLGTAFSWCYENLEGFRTFIDTIVENVKTFIMNGFNAIGNFFTETIPQWIENIGTWFSELPYKIGFAIGQALGAIIQWGADCRAYLETNVPLWINSVVTFFSELPGKIWDWLVNAYNRVVQWGADMWKKVTEIATEFVSRIITGISLMPSKIWNWLVNTFNKVVSWGSQMWSKATEVASTFVNNIINYIKELPSKVWNWFTQTISKVISFGSDAGAKAREAGGKIVDNVINAVKNLPSQIFDIGKNIVEGLWNGITSMGSWISDKVGGFFSGIVDGAKSVLGIHSPSRVFRDQVGKYMAEGVGVGFEDEAKHVQADMNNSLSSLTAKMSATVQADMNVVGTKWAGLNGKENNNSYTEKFDKLIAMFNQFVNQTIPAYKIVMDTGVLVGELAPGVNQELARASEYRERGR